MARRYADLRLDSSPTVIVGPPTTTALTRGVPSYVILVGRPKYGFSVRLHPDEFSALRSRLLALDWGLPSSVSLDESAEVSFTACS